MKKLNETPQEKLQRLERRRLKRVTESTAKKLVRLAKQKKNQRISETADKNCHRQMQILIMYMESTRHFGSAIKLRCSCLWNNEEQKAVKNSMGERSSQKVNKQRRQQRKAATCNKETIRYYHKVARDNEVCTGSNVLSMDAINKELDTFYGYSLSDSNTMSVNNFLYNVNEGPYYICTCCNRMLHRKTVRKFDSNMSVRDIFTGIKSFDNVEDICNTCCLLKVRKGRIPCQAVCNKLCVDEIPPVLQSLRKLESVLIAKRLVFQKIVVMPKEQQKKIRGAICNIPVSCETVCQSLPRPSELSGIILLKLKRKLQYAGHQYCEAVRPEFLAAALRFLKENNPFYRNIEINMTNLEERCLPVIGCHDDEDQNDPTCTSSINCDDKETNQEN